MNFTCRGYNLPIWQRMFLTFFVACGMLQVFACKVMAADKEEDFAFVDSAFVWPIAFIGREEEDYVHSMNLLLARLQDKLVSDTRCRQYYQVAREQWQEALFGPDSTVKKTAMIQSSWPRISKAPPPSNGFAAWILALHEQNIGLIGSKSMSWQLVSQASQRNAMVVMETEKGYSWVGKMLSDKTGYKVVMSDGTTYACGLDRRRTICSANEARQWILIFPSQLRACLYFQETKQVARLAQANLFWYPQFLEEYILALNTAQKNDPLPMVSRYVDCDMKK